MPTCYYCNENTNNFIEADNGRKSCYNCINKFKQTYTKCCMCDTYTSKEYGHHIYIENGGCKYLCINCVKEHNICECCGNTFVRDTMWCRCYECRFIKYVRDYFYKPTPIFYGKKSNENPYIGIEYEIGGGKKRNAEQFLKQYFNNKHIYCKYDRSIPDYGFEIVSHPATYRSHLYYPWKKIFEDLKQFEIQNTDNCGIHFHINRDFFTEDEIKALDFMVNTFTDVFSVIGKREFNHYCKVRHKSIGRWGDSYYSEHHDALNLSNANTIEFRFFKSVNNIDDFYENIKLINEIAKFAKKVNFADCLNKTDQIKNFLKEYINVKIRKMF